jgi:nitroreductase
MEQTYPIQKLIKDRWSPRAMSGEPLKEEELFPLFEAARWAPSSFNGQPWRFIYAHNKTSAWNTLFNLLDESNKVWVKNASVLLLILSRKFFEHNNKPCITHSYDTGAAWENLMLEGFARGLVVHGIAGFDYTKARNELKIPEHYQIEAMAALGKKGDRNALSPELQLREAPKERKPLKELLSEGSFAFT